MSQAPLNRMLEAAEAVDARLPWREWVRDNLARGCPAEDIVRRLLDAGAPLSWVAAELARAGAGACDLVDRGLRRARGSFESGLASDPSRCGAISLAAAGAQVYLLEDFLDAKLCAEICVVIEASLRP